VKIRSSKVTSPKSSNQYGEIMRIPKKYAVLIQSLIVAFIATNAYGQGREIQDSLIYSDPTVSKSSDYIYGGSLEYWYTHKTINNSSYSASSTLTQPGINFFVGKDNITASLTYKDFGSSSVQISTAPNNTWGTGVLSEVEGSVRIRSKESYFDTVYPYLILGYLSGSTDTYQGNIKYTSPVLGAGGIVPFNEKFGLRTDFKILSYKQTLDSNFPAGNVYKTNISGNFVTANLYWNIDKEWNAQFGARKTYYAGGSALALGLNNSYLGYFVMIGKTFNK
jgi:hypothetical protein